MYIIYDTKTDEYQTQFGDWYGFNADGLLSAEANVFETIEAAESMLSELLRTWDRRHVVPSRDEFEIREVRPVGWVLV